MQYDDEYTDEISSSDEDGEETEEVNEIYLYTRSNHGNVNSDGIQAVQSIRLHCVLHEIASDPEKHSATFVGVSTEEIGKQQFYLSQYLIR